MSLNDIQRALRQATYNNDTSDTTEAFIPYESLREIWAGDRLERFLKTHDSTLRTSEIDTARDGLLCTISILASIDTQGWSGWSRFREIFFPPDDVVADRRRDKNALMFTRQELAHHSFLGDTVLARFFTDDRWIYFPVVLNGNGQVSYGKDYRLPLFQEEHVLREGGYGKVTKEVIPPKQIILSHSHNHLAIPEAPYSAKLIVARKRFFPRVSPDNEIRQLHHLRSSLSSHKRIVSDLAMFTIGNELNIIMPWADMDLEDFLNGRYKEMQEMQPTPCFLKDIIQESRKLASAIDFLHNHLQMESEWKEFHHQAMCHADLKPRNILIFKRDGSSTGVWKITDFGVSRIAHRDLSGTRRHNSGYSTDHSAHSPKGGAYRAPEAHAQRRSDVWSFGCILVRVFALGLDPMSLLELDKMRKEPLGRVFDDCFHRGYPPSLNPAIENWIQNLPTRYGALHDPAFFEEMQKLLRSMLEIDYHHRSSASDVQSGLHRLYSVLIDPNSDEILPIQETSSGSVSRSSSTSSSLPSSTGTDRRTFVSIGTTVHPPHPPRPVKGVGVLVTVMKSGDMNHVREILLDQVDLEQCYERERPLIHAIEMTNAALIKELSEYQRKFYNQSLDVRTPSFEGKTPLFLAVCKGDLNTVKAVIDAHINPDDINADVNTLLNELCEDKTPLMQAAFLGHADVVSLLLKRGADHRICVQEQKLNCLHFAVKINNSAQANVITAFKDQMEFDQLPADTPLDDAGNIPPYETPMMLHIRLALESPHSSLEIDSLWRKKFKALLEGGADVNRRYSTGTPLERSLLQIAVKEKQPLLVQLLVAAGATLPESYIVPRGSSHDMKKFLKNAKRVP
ncbi:unnamed protein product [Penicillium glandicola]